MELLNLRPADIDDARCLFDWANTPESRAVSLKTNTEIAWDDHLAWFKERLSDPDTAIWIGSDSEGNNVGQIRLQRSGENQSIAIFVDRSFRQSGVASQLLRHALSEASFRWPTRTVIACVKTQNHASKQFFSKAGFSVSDHNADHILYEYVHEQ